MARDRDGGGLFVNFLSFLMSSVGAYVGLGTSSTGESSEGARSMAWYGGGGVGKTNCGGGLEKASSGVPFVSCCGASLEACVDSGGEGSASNIEFRATKSLLANCSARTAACDCS